MSANRLGTFLLLCTLLFSADLHAKYQVLLIGINDYSASRLGKPAAVPDRDWMNLNGAVNDAKTLGEMLVLLYGVNRAEIVTLTDQAATRIAILQSLQSLGASAAKGDVVLFYFAGHGSQVRNSLSDERDKLDESIVPADARLGVPDVRDKELRTYFNRILDRGARLTVILDSCHSGSGARGLANGTRARAIKRDERDVADRRDYGPRPESRGALVLSAAGDTEEAREIRDTDGSFHGAFSWAWIRSLRDAPADEPVVETFYRAQARMRAQQPFQSPVIAGTAAVKLAPFLGSRIDRRDDRTVVGVGRVQADSVTLQGGWANGLAVGTELRDGASGARLKVTALRGLGQSLAAVVSGSPPQTGALAEVVGWAEPPAAPLRVAIPRTSKDVPSIVSLARHLNAAASRRGVRWVANPLDSTPSHVLRWHNEAWELVSQNGTIHHLGTEDAVMDAVARLPVASSLFVQFPVPVAMANLIGAESASIDEADYILVGRYLSRGLTYSWLRPLVKRRDKRATPLPLQTRWTASAPDLRKGLMRLRKIHAWQTLESPPQTRFPYRLQIRRVRDGRLVGESDSIVSDTPYQLTLRGTLPLPKSIKKRYVYVFVVDCEGHSTLLFPQAETGSVENRLPDAGSPLDIALDRSGFQADQPFGVDTYYLLSTDEALPDPHILEWDPVRAPDWQPRSPLETVLKLTAAGTRSASWLTPASWSIERLTRESVSSRATKTGP